jgi:hypothetical protein
MSNSGQSPGGIPGGFAPASFSSAVAGDDRFKSSAEPLSSAMSQSGIHPNSRPINGINPDVVGEQVNRYISIPAEKMRNLKPWGDFFNYRLLGQPSSGRALQERFGANVRHWESNYVAVGLAILALSLLTNISLLLVSLMVLGLFMTINAYVRNNQVVLGSMQLPLNYVLLGWLVISIVLLGAVSAFGTFFWVLGLTAFLVSLHAIFHGGAQDLQNTAQTLNLEEGTSSL